MNKELNILLLDDHSMFLSGLIKLVEASYPNSVIGAFTSIASLKENVNDYNQYDIFISDLELPGENIFELLKDIRKSSDVPILVVTMYNKIVTINQCKKEGVNGYILKNDDEFLTNAITALLAGGEFYSPKVKQLLNSSVAQNLMFSERELDVMRLICTGNGNQTISQRLDISINPQKEY